MRYWLLTLSFVVVACLIGFVGGWWLMGTEHTDAATGEAIAEKVVEEGSQQIYTCSMHPSVRTPNPDDLCPICGMELIPVPADEEEDEPGALPRLRLSQRSVALMRVQVEPVQRRAVEATIPLYGRLGYDETRLRTIAAWVPGRLERLYVDFTGIEVRAGQPMVEIYSPRLVAAQEELLQAVEAANELAQSGSGPVVGATQRMVEAARDRLKLLGLSDEQVATLELQKHTSDVLTIPSPTDGVVIERLLSQGDYVETGQPVYRVADLSNLWVQLEVFESDMQWLSVGQKVTFTTQSYPGETFEGHVSFIDPVMNERSRTVRVRVDVPNVFGMLKPGMFVRGVVKADATQTRSVQSVQVGSRERRPLVIPVTAALVTGERAVVYVQLEDRDRPTFEGRDVTLGPRVGGWYIVRDGLEEGELVVTHGNFKIDSELQIRGYPSMMQAIDDETEHDEHAEHAYETFAAPNTFRRQLGKLVQANFAMVDALAHDNPEKAKQAAESAHHAMHDIDGALLENEAAQAWQTLSRTMHDALMKLLEHDALEEQRETFEAFSDALIEASMSFGLKGVTSVYVAMCPMVQGREGYWLQPQRGITNPYHGAAMFACGSITDTLVEPNGGDH